MSGGPSPELASAADPTALRLLLIERGMNSPREIEAEVGRIVRERELRATLEALRAVAASVRYHALDVRDGAAVGGVLDDIYARYGRLDGVIHGAGLVEDRLLPAKTPESFALVYGTKVDGARALADRLRGDVRFMVLFGSVSGVFGNRGQADYAAANDALDTLAHLWSAWLPGRVVSVDWGPWAGGGMVGPELERQYARRGVTLIDPEAGVAALLAELATGFRARRRSCTCAARPPVSDVAIVGIGAVFPGAGDAPAFWRNIAAGVDAITEVPPDRWDPGVYYRPGETGDDRFYCRRGGFVDDLADFDPAQFGIMPNAVHGIEPDQLLVLRAAAEAIADCGTLPDRERVGVIIGRGGYLTPGVARLDQRVRTAHQLTAVLRDLVPGLSDERIGAVRAAFCERLGSDGAGARSAWCPTSLPPGWRTASTCAAPRTRSMRRARRRWSPSITR